MKKQSGFTLIELMVVMAIIAILATAGLSAYTGYIKKARDATRIADISALNTIVLGSLSVGGNPPDGAEFVNLVSSMNNGTMIEDPLDGIQACQSYVPANPPGSQWTPADCGYRYSADDISGLPDNCVNGYIIYANFESTSNVGLLRPFPNYPADVYYYWVGTCTDYD